MKQSDHSGIIATEAGLLTPEYTEYLRRQLDGLRIKNFQVVGGGALQATNTGDGWSFILNTGGAQTQIYSLYATISGGDISVTPGTVNGIVPTMDGDALDDDPAPTLTAAGFPTIPLLRVEWVPGSYGDEDVGYVPDGVDSIESRTIVEGDEVPAMTEPEVDGGTGEATVNGVAYYPLAEWVDDGSGGYEFSYRNHGSRWFKVCGATDYEFKWGGF